MTNRDHNQLGPLEALALQAKHDKRPPLSSWSSGVARDFPLRISRDGRWHYLDSPIERASLVKLLSRVLVREGDEFFLVSPEEKLRIEIEDAPFLAVEMEQIGSGDRQKLVFRTNVDDVVIAGVHRLISAGGGIKVKAVGMATQVNIILLIGAGAKGIVGACIADVG